MKIFEIIAGVSSILSLIVSLFVANKVVKIKSTISIEGDDNITSGRDTKLGVNK